jgi:hypothetical protein
LSLKNKLVAVIELILRYHPKGLRVLVGEVEPTTEELNQMIRSAEKYDEDLVTRVVRPFPSSPQERALIRADTILSIVNDVGGWKGLAIMARECRELRSESWEIFRLHVEWIKVGGGTRLENGTALQRIAERFRISPDTVLRKRHYIVSAIVEAAIRTDRVLVSSENSKKIAVNNEVNNGVDNGQKGGIFLSCAGNR